MTKRLPRYKETWWWNRDVEEMVPSKRYVPIPGGNLNRLNYNLDVAKNEVYAAVLVAQESKIQEFTADLLSKI